MKKILFLLFFLIPAPGFAEGFAQDTAIHTPIDLVQIHELSEGEIIWSALPFDCAFHAEITGIKKKATDYMIYLVIDDELLGMSPDQKLYVEHKGWLSAKNIQKGDKLVTLQGASVGITKTIFGYEPTLVYILYVESPHTFCVGEHGILAISR